MGYNIDKIKENKKAGRQLKAQKGRKMDVRKYFEKNGKIYGVSSKFNFGRWTHKGYVFDSLEKAEKWLNTEEYDFRERELMSKTAAVKLCGRNYAFEN